MKKFLAALVFVALAAGVGMAADEEKSIVIGMGSDALFLDPQQQDESVTNTMARHLYDGLTDTVDDGKVIPGLAEKWDLGDDGVTWTFHLRKGVKFHDGSPFTAEDVKFTLDRARGTLNKSFVASVKEVVAVDDHTVKIIVKAPNAVLLEQLAVLRIIPKGYVTKVGDAEFNLKPVGTGPYRFVEWVREDHIDFIANPEYWRGEPKIKKVRFRPITNEATRTAALLTGEVDLIENVPVRDVSRVEDDAALKVVKRPGKRLIYLHVDATRDVTPTIALPKNPMKDIRVRRAMAHGINRSSIVKVIMNGNAYPSGELVLEGQRGYVPGIQPAAYDPELSQKLLAEAGYPDGFELVLDAPNGRYVNDGQVAQAIASQLAKVKIKVKPNLMPKTTFFDYVRPGDKSSLVMTGWSEPIDAGELCNVLFYSRGKNPEKGGSNRCHYSNAAFDVLLDKADATGDPKERGKFLEQASRLILEDVGVIPLYFEQDVYGMKKNVAFTPRADKYILAHTMDVE